MGILSGGLTVKRMRVEASGEEINRERIISRLKVHAFQELDPQQTEEDRAAGWCMIDHPFDLDFTYEKVFYGDYVCVSYRVDTLRIPAATLKAHVVQRERDILAESGRTSLDRSERKEMKEVVRIELRKRMLPALKTVDVAWNMTTGRVFIWTQSNGLLEEIAERFERSFEVPISAEDAVSWAHNILPGEFHQALVQAEPCNWLSAGRE